MIRIVFSHYRLFLPGAVLMLLCECAEDPAQWLLMAMVFSAFPLAGAARTYRYFQEHGWRAAIDRGVSHFLNLFLLALALFFCAMPGLLLSLLLRHAGSGMSEPATARVFLAAAGFPAVLLLLRLWPAVTISFTCIWSETGRSRRGGWIGPGLLTAWRMTAIPGGFSRYTLPLFIRSAEILGGFALIYCFLARWRIIALALRLFFYGLLLPIWSLLLVKAGRTLHIEWRLQREEIA